MAMGTTRDDGSQQAMWVATADLPQGGGYPFYERLNQILNAAGFDAVCLTGRATLQSLDVSVVPLDTLRRVVAC